MENEIIRSVRHNTAKKIRIGWIVILALFAGSILITLLEWRTYKKAQDIVVLFMTEHSKDYKDFSKFEDDRRELLSEMYDYLNPRMRSYSFGGYKVDNYDQVGAASKADKSLADVLESSGFPSVYRGSNYLTCVSFGEFIAKILFNFWDIGISKFRVSQYAIFASLAFAIAFLFVTINDLSDRKKELIIDGASVICKTKKQTQQFMIRDIHNVRTVGKSGLKLEGYKIKFKLCHLENEEELHNAILERMKLLK